MTDHCRRPLVRHLLPSIVAAAACFQSGERDRYARLTHYRTCCQVFRGHVHSAGAVLKGGKIGGTPPTQVRLFPLPLPQTKEIVVELGNWEEHLMIIMLALYVKRSYLNIMTGQTFSSEDDQQNLQSVIDLVKKMVR